MSLVDRLIPRCPLFRFSLVGVVNTLVGTVLMFLLYNCAGVSYWAASGASYLAGSVLSFFLNKRFTFGVRRRSAGMAAAFALTVAVSYAAAYGAARPLTRGLLRDSPRAIRENAALFMGMCLFTALNYLGQRFFVFKASKEES